MLHQILQPAFISARAWPWLLLIAAAVAVLFLLVQIVRLRGQISQFMAEAKRSESQWRSVRDFLYLFTRSLANSPEAARSMHFVAHYVARTVGAQSLAVYALKVDETTQRPVLAAVAVFGAFPALGPRLSRQGDAPEPARLLEYLQQENLSVDDGVLGEVVRTGKSVLLEPGLRGHGRHGSIQALMAVPMRIRKNLGGVVCAVNVRKPARSFKRHELETLERLAAQVAVGLDLVNIYSERSSQQRILQELEFGREIQRSLLPPLRPRWGDYHIAAFSHSALEVAGDFYDFVELDDNRLMIIVGDATGKGVPACMLMAMCRSFVRSLVEKFTGLESFFEHLNQCLYRDTDKAHFLTMAVAVIDRHNHICEYACAGHTPLLIRLQDGTIRCIQPQGPAVGLLPNDMGITFDTLAFTFPPGTSIMMFTDGLNEALNENFDEFGMDRLVGIWTDNDLLPVNMADLILEELAQFTGSTPRTDDQTLVIISRPADSSYPS